MIVFSQLSRDYTLGSQTVRALQDVSGEVFAGEMVALCGPSGSGKSTLLNVLGMLDSQYQGQVTFAGQPYPSGQMQAAKMRREKLGFIFQKFNLVPVMTALENVAYPL
ncbi:ATP-binding cassette domain-containing protein, partial [Vibrio sp. 704]